MTQKLYNVTKWTGLNAGQQLDFPSAKARHVKIEVNAPQDTRLDILDVATGEVRFLARIYGRDTLDFFVEGAFAILTDADDTFIYTAESERVHHVADAPESFVRVMEKRQRNPELERMMHMVQMNVNARLDAQKEEMDAVYARRERALQEQLEAARLSGGAGSEQGSADEAGSPDEPAAGASAAG